MKGSNASSTRSTRGSPDGPPSRISFRLAGLDATFDPRVDAARDDLADIALTARVFAPYYAEPVVRHITAGVADLREAPANDARLGSQLLRGERFAVLETERGWSWGYGVHDHYVGYLEASGLGDMPEPTHIVTARSTPVRAEPSENAKIVDDWSIGQRFAGAAQGGFLAIENGYVAAGDALELERLTGHPVTSAEAFVDTPYLWGGRSIAGIDCSGLVQLALAFAGIAAPRDSDLQQRALGRDLGDDEALGRGDLVFFPDHVGMMRDAQTLLHATHYWGRTVAEPFADVIARLAADHERPVLARKRLTS